MVKNRDIIVEWYFITEAKGKEKSDGKLQTYGSNCGGLNNSDFLI
jgi:hypothetical protein